MIAEWMQDNPILGTIVIVAICACFYLSVHEICDAFSPYQHDNDDNDDNDELELDKLSDVEAALDNTTPREKYLEEINKSLSTTKFITTRNSRDVLLADIVLELRKIRLRMK
jgi:hypothetical protein